LTAIRNPSVSKVIQSNRIYTDGLWSEDHLLPIEQEFVTLSTVHQAKGLEWPVVFIPWLADGRFPTDLAINTKQDQEEERRVFHVAVTRAKDELYLVVPQLYRNRSRTMVMMKPSRFLTEIERTLTEPLLLEEGLPSLIAGNESGAPYSMLNDGK
jgi:superfamily I DNA/RNA helicase